MGNYLLEWQTNGLYNDSQEVVGNASHSQLIGNNIDEKKRKVVDVALLIVRNCMQDAISAAMDRMLMPRVKMAVESKVFTSNTLSKAETFHCKLGWKN